MDTLQTLISQLNPQQKEAVAHIEGPLLLIAGAGSGKTRVVTFRIAHLLAIGVPASEILAVTFTNKAAEEMKHRVEKLANSSVLACTFHSLCARILRESIQLLGYQRDFVIFDEEDSEKVLKECINLLNLKDEKGFLRNIRAEISTAKNNLSEPKGCFEIYHLYQKKLKEYNAVDFDDLLCLAVRLLREHPDALDLYQKRWSFILIDEYQDTNRAQCDIIKLLAAKHQNVFAVGDPDQSIYSWRGADVHNILRFTSEYSGAKMLSLEQNYRSRNNILQAANCLIENNLGRFEKNLWSTREEGEPITLCICEDDRSETNYVTEKIIELHEHKDIPLKECTIFYRTNFQSRPFEDALLKKGIPYLIIGGISFYQRKEVKDILAYLRLIVNNADILSFNRTINTPKRGLGETAIEKLITYAQLHQLDILTAAKDAAEGKGDLRFSQKQKDGLRDYVNLIENLKNKVATCSIHELLSETIYSSRYLDYLKENPETYEDKRENLAELVSKASEWEEETEELSLTKFLEELALHSSASTKDTHTDALRLMTLHNSKGLEFTAVFLVGMEEDLFPHANAKFIEESIEEERRLCYVGMTRAKDYLCLTAARQRFLWGDRRQMRPSRFLKEIPPRFFKNAHKEGEESGDELSVGTTVYHQDFGLGAIQNVYNTSLGLTYDVYFEEAGATRSLVAKYAKLRAVEN